MSPARPSLSDLTGDLGLLYGGDWNPEQWPRPVWAQDVACIPRPCR